MCKECADGQALILDHLTRWNLGSGTGDLNVGYLTLMQHWSLSSVSRQRPLSTSIQVMGKYYRDEIQVDLHKEHDNQRQKRSTKQKPEL